MAREADPNVRRVIARNLRRVLRTQKKGVVTLAKEMQMPQAQLSGYLRDHRGFSIETLLRFAVALDCSLDDLVRDVNEQYSGRGVRSVGNDEDIAIAVETLRRLTETQRAPVIAMARELANAVEQSQPPIERSLEIVQAARPNAGTRRRPRKSSTQGRE